MCVRCCDFIFLNCQEGEAALLRAAATGNIAAVLTELSGHTDVNAQDKVVLLFL